MMWLYNAFPCLYALANKKVVWVVKILDVVGRKGGWNPCLSRLLND